MAKFEHVRHQPPQALQRPREMVVVVPPLRSNVNLSRIVRTAGCCGIHLIVACGRGTVDPEIARDALQFVQLERHRSLLPVLGRLREQGYRLVGLEQARPSQSLYEYPFRRKTALVLGHERDGMDQVALEMMDDVVELPIYGRPLSHNVATAAAMAMYEYCRQYPLG